MKLINKEEIKQMYLNEKKLIFFLILFCLMVLFILVIFSIHNFIDSFKITYGTFYFLFLPGYLITLFFFEYQKLDLIEKLGLSISLSLAITPLLTFVIILFFQVKINIISLTLINLIVIIILISIKLFENKIRNLKLLFKSNY